MGRHLVEDVRDIALVGHRAAGKTSLADALLYEAHAVDRLGSVDDGTSVADADEDVVFRGGAPERGRAQARRPRWQREP